MASRSQTKAAAKKRNAAPLKKQTPWGLIAGGVAVAVFAVAVIGYAATRPKFDENNPDISGLVSKEFEGADHKPGPLEYEETPPMGGPHNAASLACAVYERPVQNEVATHSLEHGAVWITYRPDLDTDDVAKLRDIVEGNPKRMLSPYPDLKSPIVASAWGRQIAVDDPEDKRLTRFVRAFTNSDTAPEKGASCGSVTTDIPLQGGTGVPEEQHTDG